MLSEYPIMLSLFVWKLLVMLKSEHNFIELKQNWAQSVHNLIKKEAHESMKRKTLTFQKFKFSTTSFWATHFICANYFAYSLYFSSVFKSLINHSNKWILLSEYVLQQYFHCFLFCLVIVMIMIMIVNSLLFLSNK